MAAVIPMIPGVYAFKAMIALVEINHLGYTPELAGTIAQNFLTTMFIIVGLALGLAMPGLIFYRRKPLI